MRASVATAAADGSLVIAAEDGLSQLDRETGALTSLLPRPAWPEGFRSNDGKVDPQGRLWWSAMDANGGQRPGFVHRYDPSGDRQVIEGIHIANSMAFSPDGRTMYLADSKRRTIFTYEIEPASGEVGGRRVFAHFEQGEPDGAAVDIDGYLWVAIWDGWRLERYAPNGKLDRRVEAPVQRPTSCIFGGPGLETLYVTSARVDLSASDLARQPLAGSLFAFEPGIRGLAIPPLAV